MTGIFEIIFSKNKDDKAKNTKFDRKERDEILDAFNSVEKLMKFILDKEIKNVEKMNVLIERKTVSAHIHSKKSSKTKIHTKRIMKDTIWKRLDNQEIHKDTHVILIYPSQPHDYNPKTDVIHELLHIISWHFNNPSGLNNHLSHEFNEGLIEIIAKIIE